MDTDCSTAEITGWHIHVLTIYTRMLRKSLNISWQEHTANKNMYGKLPLVSSKIKSRRSLYTASGTINTPAHLR